MLSIDDVIMMVENKKRIIYDLNNDVDFDDDEDDDGNDGGLERDEGRERGLTMPQLEDSSRDVWGPA